MQSKVERDKIMQFVQKYSAKKGFVLNKEQEDLDLIIDGLVANKEKYGRQYCPCRPVSGDLAVDKDKICPCFWHLEEIKRDGHCHCQLFFDPQQA